MAIGYEKNAQIWKRGYSEWEVFGTLGGHVDDIVCAAISPDGKTVVTASFDSTIKLWPVNTAMADSWAYTSSPVQVKYLST